VKKKKKKKGPPPVPPKRKSKKTPPKPPGSRLPAPGQAANESGVTMAENHKAEKKASAAASKTVSVSQMHAPTRAELKAYYETARATRKKPGPAGLTKKEFHGILVKHPEIFGHLWSSAQVTKCYNNMEQHVEENQKLAEASAKKTKLLRAKSMLRKKKSATKSLSPHPPAEDDDDDDDDGSDVELEVDGSDDEEDEDTEKKNNKQEEEKQEEEKQKNKKGKMKIIPEAKRAEEKTRSLKETDPVVDQHFDAFEEFAFHYFTERRHHLRKLEWARERHEARRRTVTVDDRIVKKDAQTRMGYVDKVIATVITLIYLLYPTLCGAAFSLISCKQIGLQHTYLSEDLQIECFAREHWYWFGFLCVPALAILIVGIPLTASMLLWRARKKLHRRYIRFRFSILFIGYEDSAFYWEVVVAVRKLTVSAISVFLLHVDTATQVLTAELFVVGVLVLHLHVQPYIHVTPKHNTLHMVETFALSTAFLTLVSGMLMFEDVGGDQSNAMVEYIFTFVVVALNFSFVLAAFWWWLTLKLMDLENVLEHRTAQQRLTTCFAMCLRRFVPDWEKEGQELEIQREQAEAVRTFSIPTWTS
jgi:hypothetical protein